MTITDISAPCLRCGRPAQPQVHHGREDNTAMGKGMGGSKLLDHSRYDICDDDHKGIHLKEWAFRLEGNMVVGYQPNDPKWITFRRGLALSESAPDPSHWTDEKLATEWRQGELDALVGLRRQCVVAAAFYQRYGWGESWYKQAAWFVTDFTGQYLDWRRMFERLRIYRVFGPSEEQPGGRWDDVDFLGATLALAVAESGEPEKALETAKVGRAEVPPVTVRRITAQLEGKKIADVRTDRCVCGVGPGCGQVHNRKEIAR